MAMVLTDMNWDQSGGVVAANGDELLIPTKDSVMQYKYSKPKETNKANRHT